MNWYKKSQKQIRLWLDDERDPKDPQIQKDFGAKGDELWVKTVEESIEQIKSGNVVYLSFDNDLGEGLKEGRHLAQWIEEMAYHKKIPIIQWTVHSKNYPASINIIMAMKNADKYWESFQ